MESSAHTISNDQEALEQTILQLNKDAMEFLQSKQHIKSLQLLNKAIGQLQKTVKSRLQTELLGLTHNNFGCVYKQIKNFDQALHHLEIALSCEQELGSLTAVQTIVNIVTIYSSLNLHSDALNYAKLAVQKLQITIEDVVFTCGKPAAQHDIATAIIAYFNLGVESEFLSLWTEAQQAYKTALQLVKLGPPQGRQTIAQKVNKALLLVNMKVRNGVQRIQLRPQVKLAFSPKTVKHSVWNQKRMTVTHDQHLRELINKIEKPQTRHQHSINQERAFFSNNQLDALPRLFTKDSPRQSSLHSVTQKHQFQFTYAPSMHNQSRVLHETSTKDETLLQYKTGSIRWSSKPVELDSLNEASLMTNRQVDEKDNKLGARKDCIKTPALNMQDSFTFQFQPFNFESMLPLNITPQINSPTFSPLSPKSSHQDQCFQIRTSERGKKVHSSQLLHECDTESVASTVVQKAKLHLKEYDCQSDTSVLTMLR